MKNVNKLVMLLVLLTAALFSNANNIRIGIGAYNPTTKVLSLTLAWDNSWHDGSGTFRDAAWIFIKYKDVTNAEWQHAILSTPTAIPITDTLSGQGVRFEAYGKNPSTAPAGSRGWIIRRGKNASGSLTAPAFAGVYNVAMNVNVTLQFPTGVTLVNPEFRAYALEMVDIPTGGFYLGDGTTTSEFSTTVGTTSAPPVYVSSEALLNCAQTGVPSSVAVSFPAAYPKGTTEFCQMKYELSREGYTEFLNTLTRQQQNYYDWSGSLSGMSDFDNLQSATLNLTQERGLGIDVTATDLSSPLVFSCDANNNNVPNELNDGQNLPVTFIAPEYGLAYLDWAGLRPMSKLEYEKSCRGPLVPVANEYAWGSTIKTDIQSSAAVNDANGPSESYTANYNGPYINGFTRRCGIFAKNTGSNRLNTGGTYYGAMEMTGNAAEIVVTDLNYTGVNGDGLLSANGYYDVTQWPTSMMRVMVPGSVSAVGSSRLLFSSGYSSGSLSDVGIRGVIKF